MPVYNEPLEIVDNDLILKQGDAINIHLDVSASDLTMGGNGSNGGIVLHDAAGTGRTLLAPSDFYMRNEDGVITAHIDPVKGDIIMGGVGAQGEVHLLDNAGNLRALIAPTFMWMRTPAGDETVRIDGAGGDIMLSGADCAELFEAGASEDVEPGTVLVIDDNESLSPCRQAYDRRVAGIVSGANDLQPGVILGAFSDRPSRVPLALNGKAFCRVDAGFGAIEIGDLLTTSATPGHAMAAKDATRAFGSVIGKALRAHPAGLGLIPVLVALQ